MEKDQNVENLQDELLILQSKNFALSQEVEMMEPKIQAMQKNCDLYEVSIENRNAKLVAEYSGRDFFLKKIFFFQLYTCFHHHKLPYSEELINPNSETTAKP